MSDPSLMEKSMRSVFVGNIPYEVTEEKMKIIFSDVGPVVSFKLVIDRDTGKSKGYGFCEYRDKETAQSAMRNLNNYEMGGRNLRVDIAGTERSRMEMANIHAQQQKERIYGEECKPEDTEQIIIERLSTLTPEQMIKIIQEVKTLLQNNPYEFTEMLEMNPQLTYAILHVGYAMNCIDKETVLSMIYSPREKFKRFSVTDPENNACSSQTVADVGPSTAWMPSVYQPCFVPQPTVSAYYPPPPQPAGYPTSTSRSYQEPINILTDPTFLVSSNSNEINANINEQEKSKLILQVLHLTNEQIASLAPEQRQSIILLRNQILEAKFNQ